MEGPGIARWHLSDSSPSHFEGIEGRHCDPWGLGASHPRQEKRAAQKHKMPAVRQGQGIEEALSVIGAEAGSRQERQGGSGEGYCPAGEQSFRCAEDSWKASPSDAKGSLEPNASANAGSLSQQLPLSNLHTLHAEKLDALRDVTSLASQDASFKETRLETAAMHRNKRRARKRAQDRDQLSSEGPSDLATEGCVFLVRDDCRLHDNPALHFASTSFAWVIPLYVHDTADPSPLPVRGAGLYWRHMSLAHFSEAVSSCNGQLVVRSGIYVEEVLDVLLVSKATALYFNRQLEPWYHDRDMHLEQKVSDLGFLVKSFKGMVLQREPWEQDTVRPPPHLLTKYQGSPDGEHTQIEKEGSSSHQFVEPPLPAVAQLGAARESKAPEVSSLPLASLGYGLSAGRGMPSGTSMPQHNQVREDEIVQGVVKRDSETDWAFELRQFWCFGEQGGLARVEAFLKEVAAGHYQPPERYRADRPWTALLSPYLRFGDLSPRYVLARARQVLPFWQWKPLVRRLFWRDGAYAQLYRWPASPSVSIRKQYETAKWHGTQAMLKSWQRGRTGFPVIDAAMRQLWKVGWMPNYLRHVTAQFLIEYLDVSWKQGLEWFDYTLVDSDVAINSMMWQMGGHSGLGAWNFVMHPVFAGKKVDPEGHYVRRWIPELQGLPVEYIHCPWEAPCACLLSANVLLPKTYPIRLVDDLLKARKAHARNVIEVRLRFPEMVRSDGHEILEVNGQQLVVRVRDDLKDNSEEISLLMTPDEPHSVQRRRLAHTKGLHHELLFEESKRYEASNTL